MKLWGGLFLPLAILAAPVMAEAQVSDAAAAETAWQQYIGASEVGPIYKAYSDNFPDEAAALHSEFIKAYGGPGGRTTAEVRMGQSIGRFVNVHKAELENAPPKAMLALAKNWRDTASEFASLAPSICSLYVEHLSAPPNLANQDGIQTIQLRNIPTLIETLGAARRFPTRYEPLTAAEQNELRTTLLGMSKGENATPPSDCALMQNLLSFFLAQPEAKGAKLMHSLLMSIYEP